jgi:hypothetical protein
MRARPYLRPTVQVFSKQANRIFAVAYARHMGKKP